jgi:hypothetical protein
MGNAIFGDFSGVHSMNYNPATISMERSIQFYGAWDTPYAALNDGSSINTINAMFVIPFWNKFSLRFDPFFTKRGALGISVQRQSVVWEGAEIYHEGIYSFIYAKDLNDVILRGARISAGVRLSLYDLGVGEIGDVTANPNFTQLGRISFGLDVGLTYDFSEGIRLGLSYKNLISPNISIMPDGEDRLPSEFRLGANWNMGNLLFFKDFKLGGGIVSYGRDAEDNRQADMAYHLGLEFKQIFVESINTDILSIRMGAVYQPLRNAADIINVSGGLGFAYIFGRVHKVSIDYGFEYGINMGAMKHSAGLTYEILLPRSAFEYRQERRMELEYEELLEQRLSEEGEEGEATETTEQ